VTASLLANKTKELGQTLLSDAGFQQHLLVRLLQHFANVNEFVVSAGSAFGLYSKES